MAGAPFGNDNATKNRLFRETLDRAIKQDSGKRVRACTEKLLDLAAEGEPWAVQMVADRLDGKAAQQVIHTGDAENPVTVQEIVRRVVNPSDKPTD